MANRPIGWTHIKTVILRNALFSTFPKNNKQFTCVGCQSVIPLNSSRFRMNRKYCYQSATKFSTMFRIGVEVYFTTDTQLTLTPLGADSFAGEHIHFGSEKFPDWPSVKKYLR